MKKFILFLLISMGVATLAIGQKRELSISDFALWNRIENQNIDLKGNYISYELNPNKGDGRLIVYSIANATNDTIALGYGAKFDVFSEFIAFSIKPTEDTLRKLKLAKTKSELLPKDSLGIMNLSTKQIIKYKNVSSFKLPDEGSSWIAFLSDPEKPKDDSTATKKEKPKKLPKKNGKAKEFKDLTIVKPFTDKSFTFRRVDLYTIAPKGDLVAFSTKLTDTTNTFGIVLFNTLNQKVDTIFRESESIKQITLDEQGKQLAFLASMDTSEVKGYSLYYSQLGKSGVSKIVDTLSIAIPKGWAPSDNGSVFFSNDGSKLFFGTSKVPSKIKKDKILDEEIPKLDIWSWTDGEIQPMQLKRVEREKKRTYSAVFRTKEKKTIQLADTLISEIKLVNKNNTDFALGTNSQPYLKERNWGSYVSDYYLINLKTGEKNLVLKANSSASLSPTAKYIVWYNDLDSTYYSMNNANRKITALTKSIPVALYDEENDMPNNPDPYGVMGWTENDEFLLIYDRYDIWRVDPLGKKEPVNETKGLGREKKTRFRYQKLDDEQVFIPTKQELLLSAFNEENMQQGFWRLALAKSGSLQELLMGNQVLGTINKAKDGNRLMWTRQTTKEFPNINLSNMQLGQTKTISDANPQQEDFVWPTVELVSWVSFAGDSLRGLLYKPDNFDPNKKYPMISYFYERSSQSLHRYHTPQPSRSTINVSFYASNGYIVFIPDIVYRTGYPGQSAYDAIVSGVQYLANTRPFIDAKRMGLQGQSWGGYQIAYLITQTDIFAAAMAGAPVSNMTSAYGGIRWGSGMSRMYQYEKTQSRMGGTLWDKPMLYLENSPVFMAPKVNTPLLIMHNDNDGAVPWYQGIEYFMALYRLNKPVWMLSYNGMEHNLESKYWANRIDLSTRMFQFFNHYLKDETAPAWMNKGVPAIEKGENLGY
ncbi:MAG: prolyl oligopeptidase family serine peptidase [Bacteroidales bacterium]|jgi:dipeptidyl aminopeptidase/acylaminoacyl peptidase|nr:prolyl oligopeptidase family serine peptidase [Bacteroidales bacterium]MDD4384682.1 prolyl oligopeptidase family serine peptidase [Bacteroidales bacterium]MDY0197063.1 prolyl oligopeptidase family serine peptidase [Tenuifilaceae bacterium]